MSSEAPASVTIAGSLYPQRCNEAACQNAGRLILRYTDRAGRPMRQFAFCFAHSRMRVERDRATGLKVLDDRDCSGSV